MLFSEYATADVAELRRRASGCGQAEIFVRDGGGSAVVIADDAGQATLPAAKRFERLLDGGQFGSAGGPWLFHVGIWTPDDYRDEFLAWYQTEHLPLLLECPVWDGCRFAEEAIADGCQFHAMHQFSDTKALESEQRKRSRSTPWFNRLARNDWFDGGFKRTLYQRISLS